MTLWISFARGALIGLIVSVIGGYAGLSFVHLLPVTVALCALDAMPRRPSPP